MEGGFDAGDGAADHDLSECDGSGVRGGVAHASTHAGIEGEVEGAEEELPGGGNGNGDGDFFEAEV